MKEYAELYRERTTIFPNARALPVLNIRNIVAESIK